METVKKLTVGVLLYFLLVGLMPAFSSDLPPPFKAVYKIQKAGLSLGEVIVTLSYDDGRYRYEKLTKAKGLLALFRNDSISELSIGEIRESQLNVLRYQYLHERRKKTRKSTIHFTGGSASGESKYGEFQLDIPEQTMDRSAVEIALMRDAGPDELTYPIVYRGKLREYTFMFRGLRQVYSPKGTLSCKEYMVVRDKGHRSTSLCLAEDLNHLPVKAVHNEKGIELEMLLVSYQWL